MRFLSAIVFACCAAGADLSGPVGFVSAASGGSLIQSGMKTSIAAKAGDFLFEGDRLTGAPGSITFFFCGEKGEGYRIALGGPVMLTREPPAGKSERVDLCSMPKVERWPSVAVLPDVRNRLAPRAGLPDRIRQLPSEERTRLEALSRMDLTDPRLKLAFGVKLQESGLLQDAAWQYLDLAEKWPAQPRLRKLVFDLVNAPSAAREIVHPEQKTTKQDAGAGKTYALVIGISKYEQQNIPNLRFAANDAKDFAAYLRTDRGAAAEVVELIDSQATSGAIRQSFNALYKKAGPRDAVVLLVAAHGDMDPARNIPMVITHRANPQDLTINAFPMSEIQLWLLGRKAPFGRATIFLDVCHAGHFAEFQTAPSAAKTSLQYYGLLATHRGPDAFAFESDLLGKGHGAFTYFLLRGLNTTEAKDAEGQYITLTDLTNYVTEHVSFVTRNRQLPTAVVGATLNTQVADLTKAGLNPFDAPDISNLRLPPESLRVPRGRRVPQQKPASSAGGQYPADLSRTIAIENRGEDILLKYLQGDEVAQNEKDFRDCQSAFHELLSSEPGSPYLEAREAFCEGRAEVFRASREKTATARASATGLLEQAVRLDPGAAYPYNALGILWLEQGQYDAARSAFEDAIQLAPQWAYPRHNLALTLVQSGDYPGAVQTYKEAMALTPNLFYLPYSLGLVYEKANRLDEADEAYRLASKMAPSRPEPYNGIGSVHALRGEWRAAKASFRKALEQPDPLPVAAQASRHDLALALARKTSGEAEAMSLWKQNMGYLPSELSAADFLEGKARRSHWRDAQANTAAIEQYKSAQKLLGDTAAALEKLGDLYTLASRSQEACMAYRKAQGASAGDRDRQRLSQKTAACASSAP
jgi:Flp pilus assembly protein TadD